MKMHKSLIDRIMRAYDMWGGRSDDSRLRTALSELEVVTYASQVGGKVLVLKEDLEREKAMIEQKTRQYIR